MKSLPIGPPGDQVRNVFHTIGSERLGIIFPGWSYTSEMPLLYYSGRILREAGFDLLQVDYDYPQRGFDLTDDNEGEIFARLKREVYAAVDTVLEGRNYREIVLIGKSLGTRAMLHALERIGGRIKTNCVWLTPVIGDDAFFEQLKSVHVHSIAIIGTDDPHFNESKLKQLNAEVLVLEGADHALERPGNLQCSVSELEKVTGFIRTFVGEK